MATVATLTFDLVAQSASLRSELNKANRHTKSWADQTRKMVNTSAKAFAGLAVTGAAGLAAIYTQAANSADQLGKFSDKLGEAPEKIQGLHRAAQLTGVSVETANMALQRMTRRVSEAGQGSGEAVDALRELNLSAENLAKLSPADQFSHIADAMKGVKNQGDRVRLAMKLFDSEGVSLVNTLDLGSQGLAEISQEVEQYGIALSRVDIAKIEAANDSWFRAKEVTSSFGNQLAVQVAPLVESLANDFLNSAKEAGGLGEVATSALSAVLKPVEIVGDAVRGLQVAFTGAAQLIAGMASTAISSFGLIAKGYVEIANLLGMDLAYEDTIFGQAEQFANTAYDAMDAKLQSLLMDPIPSEQIDNWVADVNSRATQAAEKIAADKESGIASTLFGSPEVVGADPDEQKTNKFAPSADDLTSFQDVMNSYQEVAANSSLYIEDSFATAFGNIASNISTTMATAIMEGESLKDAFGEVGKMLLTDMLSGLIKVGAQMAVNSVMSKVFQTETAATAAITGTAVATSWAPAAAMASLASFGSNAGPASAGIASTVSLASALALTGMAHDGISEVPREGTWLLDKGERVLSSQQNQDIMAFIKGDRSSIAEQNEALNRFLDAQGGGEVKNVTYNLKGFYSSNDVRELLETLNEEAGDRMNIRGMVA